MSKSATKAPNTKPDKGGKGKQRAARKSPKTKGKQEQALVDTSDIELDLADVEMTAPNNKKPEDAPLYLRPCRVCGAPVDNDWDKLCSNEQCKKAYAKKWNFVRRSPTKYRPEFAGKELREYFEWIEDMNNHVLYKTKGGYVPLRKVEVPGRLSYAGYIGVYRGTLTEWGERHPAFAKALEELDYMSEMYITNMVNMGLLDPGVAKLLLGTRHNIIEKKETENKHLHAMGFIEDIHNEADRLDAGKNE